MRLRKIVRSTLLSLIMIATVTLTNIQNVDGTPATPMWDGAIGTGVMIKSDNDFVRLEKKKITFYANEFPSKNYDIQKDYLKYSGNVKTEYTLNNPTDKEQKVQLLLPIETANGYAGNYYGDNMGIYDNSSLYTVKLDGNDLEPKIRYAYKGYSMYEAKDTAENMLQSYYTQYFFRPDLTVTVYKYSVDCGDAYHLEGHIRIPLVDGRKVIFTEYYKESYEDNSICIAKDVRHGDEIELVILGEPLTENENWIAQRVTQEDEILNGNIEITSVQTMTLKDYILSYYDEENAEVSMSRMDWYNAVMIKTFYQNEYKIIYSGIELDIYDELEKWYEYEATIAPKESVTYTSICPLYPTTNGKYDPYAYEYEYALLSRDQDMKPQTIEAVVETPYYMISNNMDSVEKTKSGYVITLNEANIDTIQFTLCEDEDPYGGEYDGYLIVGLMIILGVSSIIASNLPQLVMITCVVVSVVVAIIGIFLLVHLIRKNKKKNK